MNPQTPQSNPPSVDPPGVPLTPPPTSHNIPEVFHEMTNQTQAAAQPPAVPDSTATPLSAGDGDVIEKAWVEKVERAIDQNKYDPHAQEAASETLNQEYLKQRFGLDVGKPQDKS